MADNINKKVLIVEDDKDFRFILQINFGKEGFSVVTAENGEQGLSLVEKEKPDLIILDILMPIMDGIEMAKQVKQKGINIPIVFLTNMSDIDHISQAQEIVLSDYIIKSDVSVEKIVAVAKTKLGIK